MAMPWTAAGAFCRPVRPAGEHAGRLTARGAALLDACGTLRPGIPAAPARGRCRDRHGGHQQRGPADGQCSARAPRIFSMVVLERAAVQGCTRRLIWWPRPEGAPAAMVHCNNCTGDMDAWAAVFMGGGGKGRADCRAPRPHATTFCTALHLEADGPTAGVRDAYNYLAGEPVAGLGTGAGPLLVRTPGQPAGGWRAFMRAQLYTACATLRLGMDILTGAEQVALDRLTGHGGLFQAPGGRGPALPCWRPRWTCRWRCMETAGEGGPWGMALLAAYLRRTGAAGESLSGLSCPGGCSPNLSASSRAAARTPRKSGPASPAYPGPVCAPRWTVERTAAADAL